MARALPSEPVLFMMVADVAELMMAWGGTARTPQAVRQGLRDGRFWITGVTPRGAHVWTVPDAERLVRQVVRDQQEHTNPRQMVLRLA